jgi:hypothetical protein
MTNGKNAQNGSHGGYHTHKINVTGFEISQRYTYSVDLSHSSQDKGKPMMEAKAILSSAPVADPLPRSSGADSESSGDERTSTNGTDKASEPSAASSGTLDLTRSETRAVNRSKALVYLILLCAAAAVGTVTYFLTSNEETATFQADVRTMDTMLLRYTHPW